MARTRAPERLTRSEAGELELARAHLVALVETAVALVEAAGHDPDRGACGEAGCRLATVSDGHTRCRLAHRLALLDVTGPAWRHAATAHAVTTDLTEALAAFEAALVASLDAVRACRSTAHAQGRCWFAAATGVDGCGEVLRAAHRVG